MTTRKQRARARTALLLGRSARRLSRRRRWDAGCGGFERRGCGVVRGGEGIELVEAGRGVEDCAAVVVGEGGGVEDGADGGAGGIFGLVCGGLLRGGLLAADAAQNVE